MALLKTRAPGERRIFFPWEGRGGLRRFFAFGRVGPVVALGLFLSFVLWIGARERDAAGERLTRIELTRLRAAVQMYLFEHEGRCPVRLEEVLPYLRKESLPRDAWGRSFRLVCPTDRPGASFVLMSDGPDGVPGGLDRIEF